MMGGGELQIQENMMSEKRSETVPPASSRISLLLFFTLVTGPRRSLSLKLSDTRVYEPQIRACLGTTAHFCEVVSRGVNTRDSCARVQKLSRWSCRIPGHLSSVDASDISKDTIKRSSSSSREIGVLLPNNQRQHLAHPEGCAALRIALVTVPRRSRSCEHLPALPSTRCPTPIPQKGVPSRTPPEPSILHPHHPGGNPGANLKSISHRCHSILVAFVWELYRFAPGLPPGWVWMPRKVRRTRYTRPLVHPLPNAHSAERRPVTRTPGTLNVGLCYRLGGDRISDLSAFYRLGVDRTNRDSSPQGSLRVYPRLNAPSSRPLARAVLRRTMPGHRGRIQERVLY